MSGNNVEVASFPEKVSLVEGRGAEWFDVEGNEVEEPITTVLHRRAAAGLMLFVLALAVLGGATLALVPGKFVSSQTPALVTFDDSARVPGLEYIGMGYNIFKGNPFSSGSVDPGFTMYELFEFKWSQSNVHGLHAPTSVMVSESVACSLQMSTGISTSEQSYQEKLSNSIGADVGLEGKAFSAAYKGNIEFQNNVENVINKRQKLVTSTAQCSVYQATLDHFTLPNISFRMKTALSKLPAAYGDGSAYFDFIDYVGTHHISKLTLGARYGLTCSVTESSEESMRKSQMDIEQEGSLSYGMVEATVTGSSTSSNQEGMDLSKYVQHKQVVTVGGRPPSGTRSDWLEQSRKSPMPIRYALLPLTEIMRGQVQNVVIENMEKAYKQYCVDHLGLSTQQCSGSDDFKQCTFDSDCEHHDGETVICTSTGTCRSGCASDEDCGGSAFCRKGTCEHLCDEVTATMDHGGVVLCEEGIDIDKCAGNVFNSRRCKAYAESQDYSFDTEDVSDYPSGCYLYDGDDVYYNTHHGGTAASSSQPIRIPVSNGVPNAYKMDWEKTKELKVPLYFSVDGSYIMYHCKNSDRWGIGPVGEQLERFKAHSDTCFFSMMLEVGEPLINLDSPRKSRKFHEYYGGAWTKTSDLHPGLKIECNSCDHVSFSGFPQGYMNTVFSKYSDKIWRDSSRNNWLYHCDKYDAWEITDSYDAATTGAKDGECKWWASTSGFFLAPWWSDQEADAYTVWVRATCHSA